MNQIRHTLKVTLTGAAILFGVHAQAADSFSLEGGVGEKVQIVKAGVQWNWNKQWFQTENHHIGGYWDASIAQWRGTNYENVSGRHQYITSIGITPVFRWQSNDRTGFYGEAGIGLNVLSELYDNNDDQLSTAFQFSDHIGIGYVFNNKVDVGLKVLHYSNGGIKEPNDGADFVLATLRYSF